MAGAEVVLDDLRALLVTHNVCGIFDHMESALSCWVQELQALVREQTADFLAVHMQEVGGADWKEGNLRLDTFVQSLEGGFPEFWCSGLLCNPDTSPQAYSALGCFYLVRRTVMHRVWLWHFGGQGVEAGWRAIESLPSPLLASASLPAAFARHERFPQSFFPEFPSWSRKGFLHTRWQLGNAACDMVNVHFFHDHCNIGSLQRAENPLLSPYALSRQKALAHSMRALLAEAQGAEAVPAAFVFGDFNFRLDLAAVVRHLCGAEGLAQAREQSTDAGPQHIPLSAPPEASGVKVTPKAATAVPPAVVPPSSSSILLAPKQCVLADYGDLLREHRVWRGFDVELEEYCRVAAAPLLELPLDFPPSYMRNPAQMHPPPAPSSGGGKGGAADTRREEAQGGPVPAAMFAYEGKRCPSWCDRVVMNAEGLELVKKSRGLTAYGSQLWLPCFSDHSKVYLAFSCA